MLAAVTGGWYGAAQRYRRWAHGAPWVAGPQAADPEAAGWLRDEVGLAVWGAPSSLDWSPWYHHLAGVAGTPLHVIAGWDWPASRPHNVGREGWFPARFHPANVESWQGHRVTPYLNDLFISNQADDFAKEWEPTLLYPYVSFNWSIFSETLLALHGDGPSDPAVATNVDFFCCPAAEAAVELHAWRDATLVAGNDLDGVCYDISSGNPAGWSRCWRTEHGHPPGRGRGLIEAYDEQNRRSKAAAMAATGRYLAQGVEVVIEPIIGSIDFYVARAGAGPLGALESWTLGPEDPPGGDRELIPLFEAVYHDVGPVREDGWFTLAEDDGDLFFWLAARIAVRWGALVSLHYAINPPHRIEGSDRPAEVIDWGGALRRFEPLPELDPAKAAFVAELAAGRTELANPYLAHGRLLRPLDVGCPDIELRFARRLAGLPHLRNEGTWSVPRVVHGAWEAPDGAVGLVFVDVSPAAGPPVTLDTTLDALGAGDLSGRPAQLVTREARHQLATITAGNRLSVELPLTPRRIAVLEILPPAGQGR